jgi:hypothetical protein
VDWAEEAEEEEDEDWDDEAEHRRRTDSRDSAPAEVRPLMPTAKRMPQRRPIPDVD